MRFFDRREGLKTISKERKKRYFQDATKRFLEIMWKNIWRKKSDVFRLVLQITIDIVYFFQVLEKMRLEFNFFP